MVFELKSKNKKFLLAVVGLILLGGILYLLKPVFLKSLKPEQVACTMEAKICPDGSAVGRTGPNCEFALCPKVEEATTTAKINQTIFSQGLSLTPIQVVADSRCPEDVQCIWAGTVTVKVRISDEIETVEKVLTLGKVEFFGDTEIILVSVLPVAHSKQTISADQYSFDFLITQSSSVATNQGGVLAGHVNIGPICPVERMPPDPACKPTPEMFQTRKIFVYKSDKQTIISTISLDDNGNFSENLPVGSYYINMLGQAVGGISGVPTIVKIEDGKTVILNIDIDTGIR